MSEGTDFDSIVDRHAGPGGPEHKLLDGGICGPSSCVCGFEGTRDEVLEHVEEETGDGA